MTTPRAIVTDIEGTTSSIAFVHEVLFPYSLARLTDYVVAHPVEVAPILASVRDMAGDPDMAEGDVIATLLQWHREDRKAGPLKTLQGMIWADGYAQGVLKGHVYPDAVEGLRRWHGAGIALYVYSSGSVGAQKLLFGHSEAGDLNTLFSGHFDTAIGGKKEAASYRAIAQTLDLPPDSILFLSDVAEELDAAQQAGFAVTLLARDGAPDASPYPVAVSFDMILPQGELQ